MVEDDIALKMYKARVAGESERKIAAKFKVTPTEVRHAVARMLPIIDTAARIEAYGLQLARYDELFEAHFGPAKALDQGSSMVCLKIADQCASLLGLNSPTHMTFELAEATTAPQLTTSEKIDKVLRELAESKTKEPADHSNDDEADQLHSAT